MNNNTVELNGSVYTYEIDHDLKLATVTIAGYGDDPVQVIFDADDLRALNAVRKELKRGPAKPDPDPGAVLQILHLANHNEHFTHDRVEYRYDHEQNEWVAWGRTDIDDEGVW